MMMMIEWRLTAGGEASISVAPSPTITTLSSEEEYQNLTLSSQKLLIDSRGVCFLYLTDYSWFTSRATGGLALIKSFIIT